MMGSGQLPALLPQLPQRVPTTGFGRALAGQRRHRRITPEGIAGGSSAKLDAALRPCKARGGPAELEEAPPDRPVLQPRRGERLGLCVPVCRSCATRPELRMVLKRRAGGAGARTRK